MRRTKSFTSEGFIYIYIYLLCMYQTVIRSVCKYKLSFWDCSCCNNRQQFISTYHKRCLTSQRRNVIGWLNDLEPWRLTTETFINSWVHGREWKNNAWRVKSPIDHRHYQPMTCQKVKFLYSWQFLTTPATLLSMYIRRHYTDRCPCLANRG